jgi:hypothetical protein
MPLFSFIAEIYAKSDHFAIYKIKKGARGSL